jgi:hypothetical protein
MEEQIPVEAEEGEEPCPHCGFPGPHDYGYGLAAGGCGSYCCCGSEACGRLISSMQDET